MRRGAILAVLVVLCTAIAGSYANAGAAPKRLGVTADIRPLSDGNFACTIELSDLATGEVVGRPQLKVSSGQPASIRMRPVQRPKEELKVDVTIDGFQTSAQITISTVAASVESKLHEFRVHFDK